VRLEDDRFAVVVCRAVMDSKSDRDQPLSFKTSAAIGGAAEKQFQFLKVPPLVHPIV